MNMQTLSQLLREASEGSIPALISHIVSFAEKHDASDIHIDPKEDILTVTFRIDGFFTEAVSISKHIHDQLISHIKILARLRTDEHAVPQDGRFKCYPHHTHNEPVDIRVSIMPTHHGENAVLRLLKNRLKAPALETLGIDARNSEIIRATLEKRHGMIIVTGPTGSGKTTTLYSLIRMLAKNRLVVTIEDPIEYALPNVRQIQVGQHTAMTFARTLRSVLRQDPDVIMLGEIRDSETANIAIHAALTGHMLLTTLHTPDAASALTRLMDMGIEPYLISSTIDIIIAQRLMRKICGQCSKRGCTECSGSGFKGRTGVYEVLTLTSEIRALLERKASSENIKYQAQKNGMIPMIRNGEAKCDLGLISREELYSALT